MEAKTITEYFIESKAHERNFQNEQLVKARS